MSDFHEKILRRIYWHVRPCLFRNSTVAIANTGETAIGYLGIGLAFGLAVTIMACAVGGVSGGNFNPAVSLAMMLNKRLEVKDGVFYIISQFLGAIAASGVLSTFMNALGLPKDGFGQTDFPNITAGQAFLFEAIITFLFVFVILMVTSKKYGNAGLAPLVGSAIASFAAKFMGSEEA